MLLEYDLLIISSLIMGGLLVASACDGFSHGDKIRFWVLSIIGATLLFGAALVALMRISKTFY